MEILRNVETPMILDEIFIELEGDGEIDSAKLGLLNNYMSALKESDDTDNLDLAIPLYKIFRSGKIPFDEKDLAHLRAYIFAPILLELSELDNSKLRPRKVAGKAIVYAFILSLLDGTAVVCSENVAGYKTDAKRYLTFIFTKLMHLPDGDIFNVRAVLLDILENIIDELHDNSSSSEINSNISEVGEGIHPEALAASEEHDDDDDDIEFKRPLSAADIIAVDDGPDSDLGWVIDTGSFDLDESGDPLPLEADLSEPTSLYSRRNVTDGVTVYLESFLDEEIYGTPHITFIASLYNNILPFGFSYSDDKYLEDLGKYLKEALTDCIIKNNTSSPAYKKLSQSDLMSRFNAGLGKFLTNRLNELLKERADCLSFVTSLCDESLPFNGEWSGDDYRNYLDYCLNLLRKYAFHGNNSRLEKDKKTAAAVISEFDSTVSAPYKAQLEKLLIKNTNR